MKLRFQIQRGVSEEQTQSVQKYIYKTEEPSHHDKMFYISPGKYDILAVPAAR